jgi:hypothetical protein
MTRLDIAATVSRVALLLFTDNVPPILALALAGMVYLTWIEVRTEPISWKAKLWWCLFVSLLNIVGYAMMRLTFVLWRRRRDVDAPVDTPKPS